MSTNKSQNLNLHLWEPEDDFLRTEFNENFTAVDSAVKSAQTAAVNAQQTADKALSLPYATGSYTGNGKDISINLGFRPSFLMISGMRSAYVGGAGEYSNYNIMTGGNVVSDRVALTDTGFIAKYFDAGSPNVAVNGRTYDYIAFR